jgi:hypothetical protein
MTEESALEAGPYWKKCNSCKKEIAYKAIYWVCNVSTCNRKRTGLCFCTVSCWDAHVPGMNHRESWAEERRAPSREEWQKTLKGEEEPVKRTRTPKAAQPQAEAAPAASKGPAVILRRRNEA